ncbi:hypothetical protein [Caldicellulosiruptor kronotskyensis]|nr:hypothetical protein [Caldicellulosiruptor kronotskyensis]
MSLKRFFMQFLSSSSKHDIKFLKIPYERVLNMQNKRDEYTINFGEKRFVEDYPKVGVRSTIDGRYGGVRESLEE